MPAMSINYYHKSYIWMPRKINTTLKRSLYQRRHFLKMVSCTCCWSGSFPSILLLANWYICSNWNPRGDMSGSNILKIKKKIIDLERYIWNEKVCELCIVSKPGTTQEGARGIWPFRLSSATNGGWAPLFQIYMIELDY